MQILGSNRWQFAVASIVAGLTLPSFLAAVVPPSLAQVGGTAVLAAGRLLLAAVERQPKPKLQEMEE